MWRVKLLISVTRFAIKYGWGDTSIYCCQNSREAATICNNFGVVVFSRTDNHLSKSQDFYAEDICVTN